jgi:plastocyanin
VRRYGGAEERREPVKPRSIRIVRAVLVSIAACATWPLTGGAPASEPSAQAVDAEIEIQLHNGDPRFVGPDTVLEGAAITVVNHTSPAAIGPHTFSLVKKSALPKGEKERKRCGRYELVCKKIGKAHGIGRHDFSAEHPDVENGQPGWDTSFDGKRKRGDTYFFSSENETTSRTVPDSGTLWFMCTIHPHMQGKIKVLVN